MGMRTVFHDNDCNEMSFHVNHENLLYIEVGQFEDGPGHYNGYIALNKEDVQNLIKKLKELEPEIAEEYPPLKKP
jgi:hypothetical protein